MVRPLARISGLELAHPAPLAHASEKGFLDTASILSDRRCKNGAGLASIRTVGVQSDPILTYSLSHPEFRENTMLSSRLLELFKRRIGSSCGVLAQKHDELPALLRPSASPFCESANGAEPVPVQIMITLDCVSFGIKKVAPTVP